MPLSRRALLPLALLALAGCERVREVSQQLLDRRTPRERYVASLETAGLTATALAREWIGAAEQALREAPLVSPPFAENGYLPPAEPSALAYRVAVKRGQEVSFGVEMPGDSVTLLFVEAWVVEHDSAGTRYERLSHADSGQRLITVEPRRDGEILFRAQPELLRGGRFRVNLRLAPTLAFPVGNGRERDIGSLYGAPRDGGERDHHGIDIFAPRGTPAVAVSEAIVTRVQTTARGGNVVWLRDARGNRLYYAHLDHQAVAEGMRVLPGDTIGYVGNTGNARTTPPHLHFGVYRRGEGPVDPYWFVYRPGGALPRLVADTTRLGTWSRTPNERTLLRAAPDPEAQPVMPLARHTPLRIIAAVGSWYRVRLPDGVTGYVGSRLTEPLERAVRMATGDEPRQLLARPIEAPRPQDVIAEVSPGEPVSVLAYYGGFALVRARDGGGWGWIEREGDQQ